MSPGRLTLSIRGAGGGRSALGLVARILLLGAKATGQQVAIPSDGSTSAPVSLEAGAYAVQVLLPSGEVLQEVRQVADGETVDVAFQLPQPDGKGPPAREVAPPLGRGDAAFPRLGDVASLRPSDTPGRRFRAVGPRRADVPPVEVSVLAAGPSLADLGRLGSAEISGLAGAPLLHPFEIAGEVVTWRFDGAAAPPRERAWLRVETPQSVELLRLPLPWWSAGVDADPKPGAVELRVDSAGGLSGAACAIQVEDPQLSGLLAYLDQGRLGAARALLEALDAERLIEAVIRSKEENPLAACAAAYVGLAIFAPGEQERWDGWLPNLMTRFPDIPDGAILHARRIDLRPGVGERDRLEDFLRAAQARGAPYFTAGFELLETLWRALGKTPAASPDMEAILRLSSRVDRGQAFTVLRYPKEPAHAR